MEAAHLYLCPQAIFDATHGARERHALGEIAALPGVQPRFLLSPESKPGRQAGLTGMLFRTEPGEAIAYPGLVPDNGCGFLLARVRGLGGFSAWDELAAVLRREGGMYSRARRARIPEDLLSACLCAPLPGGEGEECGDFLASLRRDETLRVAMRQPFGCFLGHFLEIRSVRDGPLKGEHVLILHAGSQRLHRMLSNLLHERHGVHSHTCGAPLRTREGAERRFAAMLALRYARLGRLLALEIVSDALRAVAGARTELMSDTFHSFLHYGEEGVVHARGIQAAEHPFHILREPYLLLAGTQRTSSYLMLPARGSHLSHGTPEVFHSPPPCEERRPPGTLAWRDEEDGLQPGPAALEGVTYAMAEHFRRTGAAEIACELSPLFNMRRADARR